MNDESPSITALKKFSRGNLSLNDILAIEKEFSGASDRAFGVLWASLVERAVESAIMKLMRDGLSNTEKGKIFGDKGPVQTFSAKIWLGYAFNVFGPKTKHDLNVIRELRNQFAHSRKFLPFSLDLVRKVCSTLLIPDLRIAKIPPSLLKKVRAEEKQIDKKDAKTRYAIACHTIMIDLIECYERPTPRTPKDLLLP